MTSLPPRPVQVTAVHLPSRYNRGTVSALAGTVPGFLRHMPRARNVQADHSVCFTTGGSDAQYCVPTGTRLVMFGDSTMPYSYIALAFALAHGREHTHDWPNQSIVTSAALGATPECQTTKTGGHSTSLPTACCVQVLSIVTATVARRAAAARCRRTVTFPTAMSASRTSSLALVGSTCPHTERGGRVNQTRRAHRTAVRRVRRIILTQANSGACGFPSW